MIVDKDEKESGEHYNKLKSLIEQHSDILNPEIKEVEKEAESMEIEFKNGSYIQVASPKKPEDCIRGKRAEIGHWIYDYESFGMSKEELDEILQPFIRAIERNTDLAAKRSLFRKYNIPCFDGDNIQDIVLAMKKANSDLNWKEDLGDRIVYCYLLDGVVGIDFANQFHEYLERMGEDDEV